MAKLLEHLGKEIMLQNGIPVPLSFLASSPSEAKEHFKSINGPVVLKAQVLATGRMKSGGILFAESEQQVEEAAGKILGMSIKGQMVNKLLVEQRLDVVEEFYLGIVVNDSFDARCPEIIVSSCGGIDIEEVARNNPDLIARKKINVLKGLEDYQAKNLWRRTGVNNKRLIGLGQITKKIYQLFRKYDARSFEVNPLVLAADGRFYCADIKITIDDSAVYRHPDLNIKVAREFNKEPTLLETIAWGVEEGDYRGTFYFAQVATEGDNLIGYHGIGGGGAIIGVDLLSRQGMQVANFSDTSGNPPASKVYRCAKLILAQPNIKGYVCFSPITASQPLYHTARGMAKAFKEDLANRKGFPVIFAVGGNEEDLARQILIEETRNLPIRLKCFNRDELKNPSAVMKSIREHILTYVEESNGNIN